MVSMAHVKQPLMSSEQISTASSPAHCMLPMSEHSSQVHSAMSSWSWQDCSVAAQSSVLTQSRQPCSPTEQVRSEEHTSELQSRENLVCRLLLETKNRQSRCNRS